MRLAYALEIKEGSKTEYPRDVLVLGTASGKPVITGSFFGKVDDSFVGLSSVFEWAIKNKGISHVWPVSLVSEKERHYESGPTYELIFNEENKNAINPRNYRVFVAFPREL